jgi:hypothetical protein
LAPAAAAARIAGAVEKGSRMVVAPSGFRVLFLLESLFPRQIEAAMAS